MLETKQSWMSKEDDGDYVLLISRMEKNDDYDDAATSILGRRVEMDTRGEFRGRNSDRDNHNDVVVFVVFHGCRTRRLQHCAVSIPPPPPHASAASGCKYQRNCYCCPLRKSLVQYIMSFIVSIGSNPPSSPNLRRLTKSATSGRIYDLAVESSSLRIWFRSFGHLLTLGRATVEVITVPVL